MSAEHPYALRAPWYVRERGQFDLRDRPALRPEVQKYAGPDFVDRLVADPRDSLQFEREDRWSYPVPVGAAPDKGSLRERLSTHRTVHTHLRKLYQPAHDRYYATVVELFCDEPGLPRPGAATDPRLEVGFVMRRLRTAIAIKDPGKDPGAIRDLARLASKEFFFREFPPPKKPKKKGEEPTEPDVHDPRNDVAGNLVGLLHVHPTDEPHRVAFETAHAAALAKVTITRTLEGWVGPRGGPGRWIEVVDDHLVDSSHGCEEELPAWRLPPREDACDAATTRALWFGVVPTFSGEHDVDGEPKLDDHSVYILQFFARLGPERGHEHCPVTVSWSAPTRPFRLAGFFDPEGTKNRQVRVKLPDLHALAARAGEKPGPGGVQFERPPGSQLPVGKLGEIPKPGSGQQGGTATEICSFSIELITIVASFVLALFLPIVVFAFQLWWMLLLKFCWPPNALALKLLSDHFATTPGTIGSMGAGERAALDELLGAQDATDELNATTELDALTQSKALGKDLVATVQPGKPPPVSLTWPTPQPDDPLCPP